MRTRWIWVENDGAGVALLLCTIVAAVVLGCTREPDAPAFDNPFDPANGNGDLFELGAEFLPGSVAVKVSWNAPGLPVTSYIVQRSTPSSGGFVDIAEVAGGETSFEDEEYLPTAPNVYRVRARDAQGNLSPLSRVVPVEITPPPRLRLVVGGLLASRFVQLELANGRGDRLELFGTGGSLVFTGADAIVDTVLDWDLGSGLENEATISLDAAVLLGADTLGTATQSGLIAFNPSLRPFGVGDLFEAKVEFIVEGESVVRGRFFLEGDDPESAGWILQPHTVPVLVFDLPPELGDKTILAELESDFGFLVTESLTVTPDDMEGWSFDIDDGATETMDRTVDISIPPGQAFTHARFSEDPRFENALLGDTEFIANAALDSTEAARSRNFTFDLSADPDSTYVIWGMLKNDFTTSPARSQTIRLVPSLVPSNEP